MGNRAVISFGNPAKEDTTGIYLHWNGGRASVEAFLKAAKELDMRLGDDSYTPARMCQIIGNWFGGTTSIGVDKVKNLDCDNGDNGVYVVDANLNIVSREHYKGPEEIDPAKTQQICEEVVKVNLPFFKKEAA